MEIQFILFKKVRCLLLGVLIIVFPTAGYTFQYKNLDLKITGTVAEMYDDNLAFTKKDKQEDYITTLGLGLTTRYEGKRRSLGLSGRMNYRFNAKNEDIKNNSENATVSFNNSFSDYHNIGLRYSLSHSYTAESFEEELERTSGRSESSSHNLSFNYRMLLSERLSVNTRYSYSLRQSYEENREDTSSDGFGIDVSYMAGSATTFSSSYYYGRNNFDSEIHSTVFGIKYDVTEISYFQGSIGWDSSYSGDASNNNLNADISFTNQIDENSVVSISYRRGERFNSEEGDVSSNWQFSGTLSRQMTKRLNSSLLLFYGEDSFVLSETTNALLGVNLSLAYDLWNDINTGLHYSYSELNSTEGMIGYVRNTVTFNFSYSF
ncbi:hypothetical protein C4544_02130 [candidate division WS5 bacterium]|uniref:Uncharacterized protein n=1 Tax=candidate division WS5 bacterium TaxID=2093353 RepID=A0A419DEV8_9BACT|nr:MAG: hypothetical protein C4544_02130 [candidate division WS5 bacterium]